MPVSMTRRERVLAALERRQPDRVPVDLGSTKNSTIHLVAYERLKQHLGIVAETHLLDRIMQVVEVDEAVLRRLDVDTRGVFEGPPDRPRGQEIDDETYRDEWGVIRRRAPGAHWFDLLRSPLAGEISIADVAGYPWPDPLDPGRVRGVAARIEHLRRTTDSALVLHLPSPFIHKTQYLRGFEDWFTDLACAPRLISALFDAVLELSLAEAERILEVAGRLVDVVCTADDMAGQNGPLFSLRAYRTLVLPRQQRYFERIRAHTSAPILYHSCGSLRPFLDDLIALGVQAINPVQVSARLMDTADLKRDFGDRLAFWGAVDTQKVLAFGTVADVRAEVGRRIHDLAPGGGYVLAAVHNIQPEVLPERICAMFDAAREYGC
jgi:uroporphyrinogen decarboxylase